MKRRTKAFTLIELLVVVAIIGILSSVVLTNLNGTRQKARDVKRISDIKNLQLALELYFDIYHVYPGALENANDLASTYIPNIPHPPGGVSGASANYVYVPLNVGAGGTCNGYHLGAALELGSNIALLSDVDESGGTVASNGTCGSAVSGTEFDGTGKLCNGTGGTPQPSAADAETCFDVTQ